MVEEIRPEEIATIKAGVAGGIPDVPAPPSAPQMFEAAPEAPAGAEAPAPSTENFGSSGDFGSSSSFGGEEEPQEESFGGGKGPSKSMVQRDYIQELVESVIEEKWSEFVAKTGQINLWKERVNNDLISTKQEVLRLRESVERLQNTMIGQVREYSSSIKDINTEMKALEKVFEKILEPLTSNIKELQRITNDLKRK